MRTKIFSEPTRMLSTSPGQQSLTNVAWARGKPCRSASYDEAEIQIALAAISGGIHEIGDDLPTIAADPKWLERLIEEVETDFIEERP